MTMNHYPEQLQMLQQQYNVAVAEARQAQNNDLTPEGLENYRNQLVAQVRVTYLPKLAALDAQIRDEVDLLERVAAEAIPAPQGSTSDAWKRVEMLLGAGKTLPEIILDADQSQLQAIQEWGPTWLAATTHKARGTNFSANAESALANNIMDRWAQILPAGEKVSEALEAKPTAAGLRYAVDNLRVELEGNGPTRNTLAAAFGATQAAEEAAARLPSGDDVTRQQISAEAAREFSGVIA